MAKYILERLINWLFDTDWKIYFAYMRGEEPLAVGISHVNLCLALHELVWPWKGGSND